MQSALVIDVGEEQISIPRFTVRDYVEWGAELDAEKRASQQAAFAELQPKERFEAKIVYKIVPTDFVELANRAYTPAGVQRITERCFSRARVIARGGSPLASPEPLPAERAADIIAANIETIPGLARLLAGIDVPRRPSDAEATAADDKGGANPLPSGGTGSGESSPATGSATSPSSTPPTPASTPPA